MKKNILVLCPHPDDAEFACGGTIARLLAEGHEVSYAVFSPCTQSVPKNLSPDILYIELAQAAAVLGVDKKHIHTWDFPVREFPSRRQEILEILIELKKKIQPSIVFCPASTDIHQDHQTLYHEALRAFKTCCLLGYELPWNNMVSKSNYFFRLSKEHIQKKTDAIKKYSSQNFRHYADEEVFVNLAKLRGLQSHCEYAEAFELIRWFE